MRLYTLLCRFICLSICLSVCLSVQPSHFSFFGFLRFLSSLLLPIWSSDLKYSSCPPAMYLALFLVVCYVTPHPALSVCLFVCLSIHPSVCPSVRPSVFPFYFAHPSATILWPRVTCSHSCSYPWQTRFEQACKRNPWRCPKKVISVQNCMESLFFGGFKALESALQHLLKRTDQ